MVVGPDNGRTGQPAICGVVRAGFLLESRYIIYRCSAVLNRRWVVGAEDERIGDWGIRLKEVVIGGADGLLIGFTWHDLGGMATRRGCGGRGRSAERCWRRPRAN